uniref:Uncharacterized protein n=1 Tax=Ditylenchus dipsaci TaxID=166011 RepID=A0A915E3M5_9BILA
MECEEDEEDTSGGELMLDPPAHGGGMHLADSVAASRSAAAAAASTAAAAVNSFAAFQNSDLFSSFSNNANLLSSYPMGLPGMRAAATAANNHMSFAAATVGFILV